MTTEVVMPQMGADMEEGTLLRWLKHPGDRVGRGEAIAEIETDKANVELESFEEGVLEELLAKEGDVVPVGQAVARIGSGAAPDGAESHEQPEQTPPAAGRADVDAPIAPPVEAAEQSEHNPAPAAPEEPERAPDRETGGPTEQAVVPPQAPATTTPSSPAVPRQNRSAPVSEERIRVSPLARSVAARLGIDAAELQGSGPDGRVVRRDVEAAVSLGSATPAGRPEQDLQERERKPGPDGGRAPAVVRPTAFERSPAPEPAADEAAGAPSQSEVPAASGAHEAAPPAAAQGNELSRVRRSIARRMAQSKREIPHYYITIAVDMTDAMTMRASLNRQAGNDGAHISVNDMVVKAAVEAVRRYPALNASFDAERLRTSERINVCIAVALPDGLVAPALLDAGGKSLGAIARAARDLAARARSGALRQAELTDGTFTVSNLGMYGIETLIPIIQPGQGAILGVGAVLVQPAVHEGKVAVRSIMHIALAADHRVTDGAQGAEFLRELKHLLEEPVTLAL